MADLTTHYMGLALKNPVIAGSSGLMKSVDHLIQAESAQAGAVVLKSIFEEQILMEVMQEMDASELNMHPESLDYIRRLTREHSIDAYLKLIQSAKSSLTIPVIASVNCVSAGDWIEFSQRLEGAGADALELNIMITDYRAVDANSIESRYFDILSAVQENINIPVAMKIGVHFSNLPKMILDLSEAGADGLVLFNRYWSPDIDIEKQSIVPAQPFSNPSEIALPLRWIAMLSDSVECDLCGSTGVHDADAAIKLILAGAKTVQVCSALYQNGISYIEEIVQGMDRWLDQHAHTHIDEVRGKMGSKSHKEIEIWGRAQFMKYYSELD